MSDLTTKCCSKCNSIYPATSEYWYKSKSGKYGLHSQCKSCQNDRRKKAYYENVDREREKRREYWENNKDEIKEHNRLNHHKNKEERNKKRAQWRKDNPEKTRETSRNWYKRNKARHSLVGKIWRQNNKEHKKSIDREYYLNNREKHLLHSKIWNAENKDKAAIIRRNRRANKKGAIGKHTKEELLELLEWQNYRCFYCGVDISMNYTEDHYYPLSCDIKDNSIHNIYLCCLSCNSKKHDKLPFLFDERCI